MSLRPGTSHAAQLSITAPLASAAVDVKVARAGAALAGATLAGATLAGVAALICLDLNGDWLRETLVLLSGVTPLVDLQLPLGLALPPLVNGTPIEVTAKGIVERLLRQGFDVIEREFHVV